MEESKQAGNSVAEQKAKIRSRYQGIDPSLLVVIPAKTEASLYDDHIQNFLSCYFSLWIEQKGHSSISPVLRVLFRIFFSACAF